MMMGHTIIAPDDYVLCDILLFSIISFCHIFRHAHILTGKRYSDILLLDYYVAVAARFSLTKVFYGARITPRSSMSTVTLVIIHAATAECSSGYYYFSFVTIATCDSDTRKGHLIYFRPCQDLLLHGISFHIASYTLFLLVALPSTTPRSKCNIV